MKKKKVDTDLVAVGLYHLAKEHYKQCNMFVNAIYQHYKIEEDNELDSNLWSNVIEDESFSEMEKDVKGMFKKISQKESKHSSKGTAHN